MVPLVSTSEGLLHGDQRDSVLPHTQRTAATMSDVLQFEKPRRRLWHVTACANVGKIF